MSSAAYLIRQCVCACVYHAVHVSKSVFSVLVLAKSVFFVYSFGISLMAPKTYLNENARTCILRSRYTVVDKNLHLLYLGHGLIMQAFIF
jgi:hypothetical protein